MINKLIEKYKEKMRKIEKEFELLGKLDFFIEDDTNDFNENQKLYNIYREILQDLEELKIEYKKVLNDTGDNAINNFLGVETDE